jgi:hypothetical protein
MDAGANKAEEVTTAFSSVVPEVSFRMGFRNKNKTKTKTKF